jgi:propionyl-CoA synthetase
VRDGLVAAEHLRRPRGAGLVTASDVGWVVGHSYIVYAPLITGATTVLYEGKPVGTPTRARSGGSSPSTASKRCSPRRRRSARSRRRTPTASCSRPRPEPLPQPVPGRRAARPETYHWARAARRPVSTTGGRPRPAGRSRPTCAGSEPMPIKPARRRCRCPATSAVLDDGAAESPAARRRDLRRLPLPPGHAADPVADDERFVSSYLSPSTATTCRRRRVRRRGRLPVRDGPHRRRHQRRRAPAVDRARSRRCWRRTRRSPSAP